MQYYLFEYIVWSFLSQFQEFCRFADRDSWNTTKVIFIGMFSEQHWIIRVLSLCPGYVEKTNLEIQPLPPLSLVWMCICTYLWIFFPYAVYLTGLLQLIRFYRPAVYNMHYRPKGDDRAYGDQILPLPMWGVRADLSTALSTEYWGWAAFQSKMLQIALVKVMESQRKIGGSRDFFSMLTQTRPLAFKLGAV